MDATLAGIVDVYSATKDSRPAHREYDVIGMWGDDDDEPGSHAQWKTCVRDASWHPNAPMIVGEPLNRPGICFFVALWSSECCDSTRQCLGAR